MTNYAIMMINRDYSICVWISCCRFARKVLTNNVADVQKHIHYTLHKTIKSLRTVSNKQALLVATKI